MKNIKLLFLLIISIFIYLLLGIYGKLCLSLLYIVTISFFAIKKEKKFVVLILIPIILILFLINEIKNIEKIQINNRSQNGYDYIICPFISDTCSSNNKVNFYDYILIPMRESGKIKSYFYYNDYIGNIFFIENASKREKYLDNKFLSKISILYKVIFVPISKEDLIIYNYNLANKLSIQEILSKKNKCELLLYGSQNGWVNYKNQLIYELKNDKSNKCIESINEISLKDDEIIKREKEFISFLLNLK